MSNSADVRNACKVYTLIIMMIIVIIVHADNNNDNQEKLDCKVKQQSQLVCSADAWFSEGSGVLAVVE